MAPWPPKAFFMPGSPSITMLRRLEQSQLSQKLSLRTSLAGMRLRALFPSSGLETNWVGVTWQCSWVQELQPLPLRRFRTDSPHPDLPPAPTGKKKPG